jgi:hypothetical protein
MFSRSDLVVISLDAKVWSTNTLFNQSPFLLNLDSPLENFLGSWFSELGSSGSVSPREIRDTAALDMPPKSVENR